MAQLWPAPAATAFTAAHVAYAHHQYFIISWALHFITCWHIWNQHLERTYPYPGASASTIETQEQVPGPWGRRGSWEGVWKEWSDDENYSEASSEHPVPSLKNSLMLL